MQVGTTVAAQRSTPATDIAPANPVRVLLIEDNPMDVRLIGIMLRDSAPNLFQIEQVDRLETGLQQLGSRVFDLVLVDLSLPDSHGLETFSRVHAVAPKVPIIVLSGLADETVAVSAVHEGAQDYLVKGQVS